MSKTTLTRFRAGVKAKQYSLTEVARLSGIPLTTLADMLSDDWGGRVFKTIDRLDSLQSALDGLEEKAA